VKILFYSSKRQAPGVSIGASLRTLVPDERIEIYHSIENLAHGLLQLLDPDAIVILQAGDRQELLRILSLRDLLQGVRVILLVPDREEETISLAHRFRPRFLASSENDFSNTMSVVRKMLGYGEER
jgi:hypothetical protein